MAVSTRMAAPNYKIYEPDALDAIYAKGNLDPIMGGISYAFGNAHKLNASMDQEDFTRQQSQYNRMAAALDAMEIDSKTKQEALKLGVDLIKHGTDASGINGIDALLTPGAMAANDTASLFKAKTNAEIAALGAKGASGGDDVVTTKISTTPPGENRTVEQTYKSKVPKGSGPTEIPPPTGANPKGVTPVVPDRNTESQKAARITAAMGGGDPSKWQISADKTTGTVTILDPTTKTTKRFDVKTGNEAR